VGSSVLDAIGHTPLVELSRSTRDLDGRILAKLDYLNPGGSKKDRIAVRMIRDAEASGDLSPGQPVVELTSGNTGTGLAIVCAVTGHPFVAVMSAGNSEERAQMMQALGAEVILVDQQEGSKDGHVSGDDLALVEQVAAATAVERGAYRADQFHLAGNPAAHEETAAEIWEQSGGGVDVFCEFPGTGGTFAGMARFFKAKDPSIACYVVEPVGAAVLAGESLTEPGHRIQGGGYSMPSLPLLDRRWSTASSRSPTPARSTLPEGSRGRKGSSPASRRVRSCARPRGCSRARTRVPRSRSCSPTRA